mmetsp:Transcript_12179/g.34123  ORF Transcript_12179/g.34123 Transcript_12179/m.34123 type:complete len:211 (-) Transcript_12179:44-676(-)
MAVQRGRQDPDRRHLLRQCLQALRARDDVEENDRLLIHPSLLQHIDGLQRGAASGEHRIAEEDRHVLDFWRELVVEQLGQGGLLVALYQDLGRLRVGAHLTDRLQEDCAGPHDVHAANVVAVVRPEARASPTRGLDRRLRRKPGQPLLGEDAHEPVRGAHVVLLAGVLVADDAEQHRDAWAAEHLGSWVVLGPRRGHLESAGTARRRRRG